MIKRAIAAGIIAAATLFKPAFAAETPSLKVAMTTWVGYGLLHLAQEKGFFAAHDAKVELVSVQDKASTAAAIATGRLDGWATTVDTFIFYNAQKIGVKQVLAVDFSAGGEGLVTASDIKTVKDLKGRRIGAEEGSATYFFLLNVLADEGLSLKDIDLQNMRAGDAGAAFVAGRLDGAATWDPWLSQAGKRSGHVLVSSRDKPGLIVDTVAFRSDVIEQHPEAVAGFIQGYFDAYDYWKANSEEANKIMADALGIKIDEFRASLAGLQFVSREDNAAYIGSADTAGKIAEVTKRGADFYKGLGLLKADLDPASVVDGRPLAAALGGQAKQ